MSSLAKSLLRQLSDIISDAVTNIDNAYSAAGLQFPSLNEPSDPTNPAEALTVNPEVLSNAMLIIAAADQISSTVRQPASILWDLSLGFHFSSVIRTIIVADVPEILREEDPNRQGIHTKIIAAKNGMDADKLSRCLRLLATHHVFREVEPDVYAHNRLSSMLDTMKSSSQITDDRLRKHVGTPGFAALLDHSGDEVFYSSIQLSACLTDPKTAHSDEYVDSPFNRAYNTTDTLFEWYGRPENLSYAIRFNVAMDGINRLDDREAILRGFPWDSVADGSKVVDVGGGMGQVSLLVAKKYPKLKFIIQDSLGVISQGREHIKSNLPGAQESGRITFQVHNFFESQSIKDASIFMLRIVTHDWSPPYVVKILKQLREAAVPGKTRLLLIEQILPYTCKDMGPINDIPGTERDPVPEPLLQNLGKANSIMYLADFQMMTIQFGQERTVGHMVDVTSKAGWKIVHFYSPSGSIFRHIVAETA